MLVLNIHQFIRASLSIFAESLFKFGEIYMNFTLLAELDNVNCLIFRQ